MAGRLESKLTSTTAPMTWLTRPTLLVPETAALAGVAAAALVARGLRAGFSAVGAAVAMGVFLAFVFG